MAAGWLHLAACCRAGRKASSCQNATVPGTQPWWCGWVCAQHHAASTRLLRQNCTDITALLPQQGSLSPRLKHSVSASVPTCCRAGAGARLKGQERHWGHRLFQGSLSLPRSHFSSPPAPRAAEPLPWPGLCLLPGGPSPAARKEQVVFSGGRMQTGSQAALLPSARCSPAHQLLCVQAGGGERGPQSPPPAARHGSAHLGSRSGCPLRSARGCASCTGLGML